MEENEKRKGKVDLPAERKLITVMFADIAGFTRLAETIDPEQARDLMNACFELLVPSVIQYGGTVDKFIGDEIMALFGAPIAHENDPERALRAALSMKEAIVAFNKARGLHLEAHFGINRG
jgi:adenylate cyclase